MGLAEVSAGLVAPVGVGVGAGAGGRGAGPVEQSRVAAGGVGGGPVAARFIRADGPAGVAYYSDAAVICPALDLPMVIIGPGEIGMSGRIDEHVSLDKLVTSRAIFRRVAERMLGC